MAIVTFNRVDLEKLVGKKLTEKDYQGVIPMLGVSLEELRDEEVDFDICPDRPDMLSVEGFARALQGFLGLKKGLINYEIKKSRYEVHVDKSVLKRRGCAAFAVIKNLPKFSDETVAEFMQLQDKLVFTIGRRRKKAAMGSYHLEDLNFPIRYTTVKSDFKFVPLLFDKEMSVQEIEEVHPKGIEYKHMTGAWDSYPAFIDNKKNTMAVLPYTNAQFGKIRPETRNMLIEVTGTEWKAVFEMLNVVVSALADRGASIYEVKTVYPSVEGWKTITAPNLKPWRMRLDTEYANKLLDLDLKPAEIRSRLEKMRYGVSGNNILVPAYRTDVMHPIDLVEDICIAHGYEKFEPRIPSIATIGKPRAEEDSYNRLKEIMVGLGFQEVVNFVLSNHKKEFEMVNLKPSEFAEIANPKSEDYVIMRTSLIPSLLGTLAQNASTELPQRIFELGKVVKIDSASETGAVDICNLGAAILHSNANYSEMKSYLETFFKALGKDIELKESKVASFIEGRAVDIYSGKKLVGVMGEVHPEVLSNFGLEYPVTLFELYLFNM